MLGMVPFVVMLLTWTILLTGFHRHVESGPRHSCQVCSATQVQATSVELHVAPAAPLKLVQLVIPDPDRTPRIQPHVFVPNRAPPLA